MVCWGWFVLTQRELMLNFQESFEKANFILVAETDNDGRIYIMEIGQCYKEGPPSPLVFIKHLPAHP